jgi:hypothetical protein
VAFHKTVAGLERVLQEVLRKLLSAGLVKAAAGDVRDMIRGGSWAEFDDGYLLAKIRRLHRETHDQAVRLRTAAILKRTPPKLVGSLELLGDREDNRRPFRSQKRDIRALIPKWVEAFDLPEDFWLTWDLPGMALTKIGSYVPASAAAAGDEGTVEKQEQAIRILEPGSQRSRPIMEVKNSLLSVLADQALYASRVYVLLPPDRLGERDLIQARVQRDLDDL